MMDLKKELIIFSDLYGRNDYDFVIDDNLLYGFYYPSIKKWDQRTGGNLLDLFKAMQRMEIGEIKPRNICICQQYDKFIFQDNCLYYITNNNDEVVQLLYIHTKDNIMIDNKQEMLEILKNYTLRFL